ncbi:MAG: ketoacyl-ACP synthase III [Acidobacteria bacterium]|nr:ketoacyl-ACP synthase III [Acidobacteriota bacterium]
MTFLNSFGAALPGRAVTNEELSPLVGRTPEWILNVSGIQERRWVDENTSVVDLAAGAAQDCLGKAKMEAKELGMILLSCSSGARQFPGPAVQLAHRLGLSGTPAVDIPLASAGALFGMSLAGDLAAARGPILVVAAEIMSRIAMRAPQDSAVSVLFGDGAGACLIHPDKGMAKIRGSLLGSDGAFAEDLKLEFGTGIDMNGRSVILQATRKIPRGIADLLGRLGVKAADVGTFLMHQANQNLIDRVADSLGVERSLFFSNIRRYGNTSSASMLIAASEWAAGHGFQAGGLTCFAAFGAGYNWGALLAEGV